MPMNFWMLLPKRKRLLELSLQSLADDLIA